MQKFFETEKFFSINVRAVCGPNMLITNIVCRWPGATHDSRIFENSAICFKFETNLNDGLLLGDDGYPCRYYLMTPVSNPVTAKERNYNKEHIATRRKVERTFGVWKQRFRCLRILLPMHLENSLAVIVSTAYLYDFAINNGDFIEDEPEVAVESIIMNSSSGTLSINSGRQRIIDNFF